VKVLIDTNIVLDLILEREPFIETAITIFEQVEQGTIQGYIAATTITNIFYIVRKIKGREVALTAINRLLVGLHFCPVDHQVIQVALALNLDDFEDGIQLACATINQLPAIVTRDPKDFVDSALTIYSPSDFLNKIQSNSPDE
jgi:predicted nucleic acid-binding protein